ncbi:hydroxypyruvate reductase [Nitzschia inconspicua]|uniref:Hydroxypyruvate reductase n=1 Tax=Nitzschia inconspicua TaxID=303405 RepID=A0A9K3K6A7_9STRA|nr:hydroxypyruvate reductase [Nitzschia inconspicua]KAG7371654.1 hydroxypyruvate reductase [Nitzschia inconspicua]
MNMMSSSDDTEQQKQTIPSSSLESSLESSVSRQRQRQCCPLSRLEGDMTRHALQIVDSAIHAVNPYTAIQNAISISTNNTNTNNNNNNDDDDDDDEEDPTTTTNTTTATTTTTKNTNQNHQPILTIQTNLVRREQQQQQQQHNKKTNTTNTTTNTTRSTTNTTTTTTDTTMKIDLNDYNQIVIVAFGKASSAMATATIQQLYPNDDDDNNSNNNNNSKKKNTLPCVGVVICKDGHATPDEVQMLERHNITVYEASHPVPDDRSITATNHLIRVLRSYASSRTTTLTFCLISGGGSSLLCRPSSPLTLEDIRTVNTLLLRSGMDITQMNVIRKKLEHTVKGGGITRISHPSTTIALVLSDVLGDPLDLIASGPTVVPDTSTYQDAWDIIMNQQDQQDQDQHQQPSSSSFLSQLPPRVVQLLKDGLEQEQQQQQQQQQKEKQEETEDEYCRHSSTILVGNNALAVQAAARKAQQLGYHPIILGTEMQGEAKEVAKVYVQLAKHLQSTLSNNNNNNNNNTIDTNNNNDTTNHHNFAMASSLPVALIAGGETTVTLNNNNNHNTNNNNGTSNSSIGKGGRNQELALSAAIQLEAMSLQNIVLASVGTDGGDGPNCDAAGAVVTSTTINNNNNNNNNNNTSSSSKVQAQQALRRHDAYTFFNEIGQQLQLQQQNQQQQQQDDNSDHDEPTMIVPPPPLVKTGPTGTNVADICVTLIHHPSPTILPS